MKKSPEDGCRVTLVPPDQAIGLTILDHHCSKVGWLPEDLFRIGNFNPPNVFRAPKKVTEDLKVTGGRRFQHFDKVQADPKVSSQLMDFLPVSQQDRNSNLALHHPLSHAEDALICTIRKYDPLWMALQLWHKRLRKYVSYRYPCLLA
jgi:hypothetical protein